MAFLIGFIVGCIAGIALMALFEVPEKWIYSENEDDR